MFFLFHIQCYICNIIRNPIAQMSSAEIADEPPGTTECPYVEVGQKGRASGQNSDLNPAKRIKAEDAAGPGGGTGKFFFGDIGGSCVAQTNTVESSIIIIITIIACYVRCE